MAQPQITFFKNPKATKYSWIGVIVTIGFVVAAIYILFKFSKKEGFWFGVLMMLLFASYLTINKDGVSFSLGGILESKAKEKNDCPDEFTVGAFVEGTADNSYLSYFIKDEKYYSQKSGGIAGVIEDPKEITKEEFLSACINKDTQA